MKVAYIISPDTAVSGDSNGIKTQAVIWANGLRERGNIVDEINPWFNYKWEEYDLIHVFGVGLWLDSFIHKLKGKNENIVISPIIDPDKSFIHQKLKALFSLNTLKLYSLEAILKRSIFNFKLIFVRSEYEMLFVHRVYNIPLSKIRIVAVPFSFPSYCQNNITKENFCLHVSSIYQPRKNVIRLIEAAKKYKFRLILVGNCGSEGEFKPILNAISDSEYVRVLGFVTKEDLLNLYCRARVFALPSINEGVGIVALDAAVNMCDIVLTNIGGPKEYFNNLALFVDPYNVDEIGLAITKLLNGFTFQPDLRNHIINNYSEVVICENLEKEYKLLFI